MFVNIHCFRVAPSHKNSSVSGLSATDKMSMYDMTLTFAYGGAFFVVRFWVMAFCQWQIVQRSINSESYITSCVLFFV